MMKMRMRMIFARRVKRILSQSPITMETSYVLVAMGNHVVIGKRRRGRGRGVWRRERGDNPFTDHPLLCRVQD